MLRARRESLVLQRIRHLTDAEGVLCALPVGIRDQLPLTSRVIAALKGLPALQTPDASRADQVRIQWLAATLVAIQAINAELKEIDRSLLALLDDLGSTLTDIVSVGVVTAITLLIEVGDPRRFATEAKFARCCRNSAPVPASFGEGHGQPRRLQFDLAGNRTVNSVLHIVHVTQARKHEPAWPFSYRSIASGKAKRAARRSHKRQLANVTIRHMWKDAERDPFGRLTRELRARPARSRRAVRGRGRFPTENAALRCVYLTVRSLDPTGKGTQRWMNRWKQP